MVFVHFRSFHNHFGMNFSGKGRLNCCLFCASRICDCVIGPWCIPCFILGRIWQPKGANLGLIVADAKDIIRSCENPFCGALGSQRSQSVYCTSFSALSARSSKDSFSVIVLLRFFFCSASTIERMLLLLMASLPILR